MIITEVKCKTGVSREAIWKIWTDVENWKIWDNDVEYSCLSGDFKIGAIGTLKSVGSPKTKFTITECVDLKMFVSESKLPFCRIKFIHIIEERSEGLEITHKIEMSGVLSFLFARLIGKQIAKGVPQAVKSLIDIAKKSALSAC